jgi:hypothetical protein
MLLRFRVPNDNPHGYASAAAEPPCALPVWYTPVVEYVTSHLVLSWEPLAAVDPALR